MKPITNCPNCGGVLDNLGHCDYCGANVKIGTNAVDIGQSGECDITLNFRRGNSVYIYPLRGAITKLTVPREPTASFYAENVLFQSVYSQRVSFTFEGDLKGAEE